MHCLVSGKVQGVWFRASTQEQAQALGVTGWVCNLADGRVEVMAYGEEERLEVLFEWLKKGPELARVEKVTYNEIPWEAHSQFIVK